jgi:molybdopterin-guanine dinucleotide biosynthesis protein A
MIGKEEISGFILAGGKSSRMGTDKALLMFGGEPLLERAINQIRPFCRSVSVSGQNPEYRRFGVPLVSDVFSGSGPIAGIHACLTSSSTDWNLLVGVDLPFLNDALFRFLLDNADGYDCVIPRSRLGIEPLSGLYHRRSLPEVERQIHQGDFKLINLLQKLNVSFADCNSLILDFPRLFVNLNYPDDYLKI